VPVNTRLAEAEVAYIVADSGSKFVFEPKHALPQGRLLAVEDLEPDDVAAVWYTSGTTGFPKGASLTHLGFLSNVETCRRIVPLPSDGSLRGLISVPLFHATGCNSQLLVGLELRGTAVIMPVFQVQTFLQTIAAERISAMTSVPTIYWLALNQPNFRNLDTSGVRVLCYGGAPIAPDLVEKLLNAFPNARVGNGFGLTETSSVATYLPHEYARTRPETVGFAAPVVDLDLDTLAGSTEVGELLVRGPNVMRGYWNNPQATAENHRERLAANRRPSPHGR
jgi:long-chain acyl-CoA synthetase